MNEPDRGRDHGPLICVADVERLAAQRLPAEVWDFVAGGSGDESVQAANRAALDLVRLVPRALTGAGIAKTCGQLLLADAAMPVVVAPMAYQRLLHPNGELDAARAARTAGVPYVIPMLSSYPLEEIAEVGGTVWFQMYWLRDRGLLLDLVRRAEHAGCEALVVTADVPVMGRRLRDLRNGFALPASVTAANLGAEAVTATHTRRSGTSAVATHSATAFDPTADWADVEWLRGHTDLPIVLKGILDPRDAVRAAELGAEAVVVSNHGGRQFAGAVPSITALPPVLDAVQGRCAVLLDSGVRSGTDVLRALAHGAAGVMYGRPVLWGLAVDGKAGAGLVLDLLHTELREALTLCGCDSVAAGRDLTVMPA
ncbi:4-hydroxymandelate oxidase [Streptomyces sp. SAI-135]|uniref:alpha-hydroxy acid oxidase n=1 Tax=Streptomyces sp. SAI-124 TaxID=3377730 RepID=UPI00247E522C|nr:4-hydroxymandelate oxidase [Streptomyces sp. SAI-090]MDH6574144.1 4-hydroxymandelate oxidase [Streptomyces sp. SAI-117]MDH6581119.1 4-hydroxymandelate oxidase [Streptomyces sp. SAI-133]MDH6613126.1 4-hydroxymandelate oxidase [Streptomyces sp. SAI-135]